MLKPAKTAVTDRLSDRLADLGDICPTRILLQPSLGHATLADARSAIEAGRPCEWVDGTLVHKAMGWQDDDRIVIGRLAERICSPA